MTDKGTVSDANVDAVIRILRSRMQLGLIKYGVTTERDDLDLEDWVKHIQEELLDAAVYAEKIKSLIRELRKGGRGMPRQG